MPSPRYSQPSVYRSALVTGSVPTNPSAIPTAIAIILRIHQRLLTKPTVASASIVNAQSSGIPSIIIRFVYQGNSANVSVPHNSPLTVLVVTAAVIAYVA